MSAANRRRGADAERSVVAYLRVNGFPDARRYLAGDGRQPGDIDAIPGVCIEVKDVAKSAWPTWRAQALAEAGPDRIPIVVRRRRGQPDAGQWEAQIPWDAWLDVNGTTNPVPEYRSCGRTERVWVTTHFATIIDLLREDTP